MLPRLAEASAPSPDAALRLIVTLAAQRRYDELWDAFLEQWQQLRRASTEELLAVQRDLNTGDHQQSWQVATICQRIRQRFERLPSSESCAVGRLALDALHTDRAISSAEYDRDPVRQLRAAGSELIILLSIGDHHAASDAADMVRTIVSKLSAEQQVRRAAGIRKLFDFSVDAYIGACRLNDAETTLDSRGPEASLVAAHEDDRTRAFLHAMRGDVATAAALLEGIPLSDDDASTMSPRERIARAAVLLESGSAGDADALLRPLEPHHHRIIEWPFAAIVTARVSTAVDPAIGCERLQRMLHRNRNVPTSRRLRHLLYSAVVDLALTADDVPSAQRMLKEIDPDDHALRISAARLALIQGDQHAIDDLSNLVATPAVWPRLRSQALTLLALHLNRSGLTTQAQEALHRAIGITEALNIRFIHALMPLRELHQIADDADIPLPVGLPAAGALDAVLSPVQLTERESTLLSLLATHAPLRTIAQQEFVSLSTVKTQLRGLYRKLRVSSRDEAVIIAARRGLVSPHAPRRSIVVSAVRRPGNGHLRSEPPSLHR